MTRPQGAGRGEIATTAVLVACWLACTAWLRALALPDEGRYVGVAWEMMRSGNWLVPTMDGLPYFHKPPLFYWITAAAQSVFGVNQWAARTASLLGAVMAAVALYMFARRWVDARVARWATVALVTMPFFFGAAQYANLDMLVAACISVTILLCAHAALSLREGGSYRAALVAAYAMAALGLLAKGLIGIVLPAGVIVLWLLAIRQPMLILKLVSLPGLAVFAIVGVPWFAAMQREFGSFFQYFFIHHHFQRFEQSGFNNQQPFWFYLPVLVVLSLPWIGAVFAGMRGGAFDTKQRGELRLLMWVWLVTIVGFFSIPSSKLVGYIIPAVPPLAFLVADGMWKASRNEERTERTLRGLALAAGLLCLGAIVAVAFTNKNTAKPLAAALAAQREAGEPVVFLDGYFHDVVVYAKLAEPVTVVEDWNNPDVAKQDNWRKELFDTAQFDPPGARKALVPRDGLGEALCAHPATWVVGPRDAAVRYPQLQAAKLVATAQRASLWKVTKTAGCTNANGN